MLKALLQESRQDYKKCREDNVQLREELRGQKRRNRELSEESEEMKRLHQEEVKQLKEKSENELEEQRRSLSVILSMEFRQEIKAMKALLNAHNIPMSYLRQSDRQQARQAKINIDIQELKDARDKAKTFSGLDRNVYKPSKKKKRRLKKVNPDSDDDE